MDYDFEQSKRSPFLGLCKCGESIDNFIKNYEECTFIDSDLLKGVPNAKEKKDFDAAFRFAKMLYTGKYWVHPQYELAYKYLDQQKFKDDAAMLSLMAFMLVDGKIEKQNPKNAEKFALNALSMAKRRDKYFRDIQYFCGMALLYAGNIDNAKQCLDLIGEKIDYSIEHHPKKLYTRSEISGSFNDKDIISIQTPAKKAFYFCGHDLFDTFLPLINKDADFFFLFHCRRRRGTVGIHRFGTESSRTRREDIG